MLRFIAVLVVVVLAACREDQQDGGTDERVVTEDGAIEFHLPGGFELTPDVPIAPPPGTRTFGVARAGETPAEFEFVVGILSAGVRPPFELKGEQGQASRDRLTRTARNGGATGLSAELTERSDRIELVVEFETRLETLSQEAYVAFEAGPYVFIVAEATGQSLTKDEQEAIFDAIIATLEFRESWTERLPLGTTTPVTTFYTYDFRMRPKTIVTGTQQNLTFTYDAASNVQSIADTAGTAETVTFGYDSLNRLISATGYTGGLTANYTYNNIGNLLTKQEGTAANNTLNYPASGAGSVRPHAAIRGWLESAEELGYSIPEREIIQVRRPR